MRSVPAALDEAYRRAVIGFLVGLAAQGVLLAVLLPFRPHLSVATPALAFVVPVIVAVVMGGFAAGVGASVCGFVLYDVFFIRPYGTLAIHSPADLLALVVYVA